MTGATAQTNYKLGSEHQSWIQANRATLHKLDIPHPREVWTTRDTFPQIDYKARQKWIRRFKSHQIISEVDKIYIPVATENKGKAKVGRWETTEEAWAVLADMNLVGEHRKDATPNGCIHCPEPNCISVGFSNIGNSKLQCQCCNSIHPKTAWK